MLLLPAILVTLGLGLVIAFKQIANPVATLAYGALYGVALGAISEAFNTLYDGIVMQAVMLTFGTLFALLFAYRSGLIKATENFKLGVVAATAWRAPRLRRLHMREIQAPEP